MLFQKQERSNRMRPQPDKTRYPPPKHPSHALSFVYTPQQTNQPLFLLGAHHPRLNHIYRTAYRRRHKPSCETRREMRRQVIRRGRMRQQHSFEPIIARKLRRGHEHCAHTVRPDPAEETAPAFFARHTDQAVEGVVVVPAFGAGQGGVVLHADVENIGRVASYAA